MKKNNHEQSKMKNNQETKNEARAAKARSKKHKDDGDETSSLPPVKREGAPWRATLTQHLIHTHMVSGPVPSPDK